jgi:starvation-inducible DNA-binding protein
MKTTTREAKLLVSHNDLSEKIRKQIVSELLVTLATTVDLYTQTKQAHWNVKGPHFMQLHELFDETASKVNDFADMVAERITALGGLAYGTSRYCAEISLLPEYPLEETHGTKHLEALVERYGAYAAHVRSQIDSAANLGDAGTADLYTEISRDIDKSLWFLEAHLAK